MNLPAFMEQLDRQEAFDKVVKHLRTQGRQAMDESGDTCMYRAPDGTMCAIGCLIPDELYHEDLEFNNAVDLDLGEFYQNLQTIHDVRNPVDWEDCFKTFAEKWGLKYVAV